ncbi:4'-phosphopantetheinyl transferase superfamily protein [Pseudoxanthomonas sp. LH2527]|uniref:4'-phosphopantetheinyl transferase family protein n=1 Tax=Pseudoxanthomonas sp. LH2527 TaxID=2923249 RepID=UPI001F1360E2|nr:4'-phosphopantetheinyl transferase superfamily protein [Pseudoxanthomonas sp. LH2527]
MPLASAFPHGFGSGCFSQLLRQNALVAVFALDDWRAWTADALHILDVHEHERVRRQRRERDRHRLALAYALHRLFLAQALSLAPARVPLVRDAHGRPLLEGLQAGTSLSHADDHVAVAVSLHGPIGVDIEPIHRVEAMADIAERICHGDERTRIAGRRDAGRGAALLDLWVRKEAFLKAAGVGLGREMDTFALPEGEPTVLHPGQSARVCTDLLDLGPDVVCAVSRGPDIACVAGRLWPMAEGTQR